MTDLLSTIAPEAFKSNEAGMFKAKLDFADRCAVLALARSNVLRTVIAKAFRLDKRTVGHIVNESGPKYKDVRREYQMLGHDAFIAKYITERVAKMVSEAAPSVAAPTPAVDRPNNPRHRSNKLAGLHTMKPEQCSYSHRVEIAYKPDLDPPGWYYRDLDSSTANTWLHNGEESLTTSQMCYKIAELNLTDD